MKRNIFASVACPGAATIREPGPGTVFGAVPLRAAVVLKAPRRCAILPKGRGVAQLGSAPAWGAGGRWFESSLPDQIPLSRTVKA